MRGPLCFVVVAMIVSSFWSTTPSLGWGDSGTAEAASLIRQRTPTEDGSRVLARERPLIRVNTFAEPRVLLPFVAREADALSTGFQVQSLEGSANLSISYFSPAGQQVATQTDTLPAGSSKTYFGGSMNVSPGFLGSAVVTSTNQQKIAVIVNVLSPTAAGLSRSASYDGVAAPYTQQFLPLIQRENSGWNTEIFVQNTHATQAASNVTLEYFQGTTKVKTQTLPAIGPGASARIRQVEQIDLGDRWVGSVKVTANVPVAAVVNEIHPHMLMAYTGFLGGVSRVSIPLVMTENGGWSTGIQVQNVGSGAAAIRLRVAGSVVAEVTIAAGSSQTWFPIPGTQPGFVGAATIEGPASAELVAIVNQLHLETSQAMCYRGFGGGTEIVSAPLIMHDNAGWNTGMQIQNAGADSTRATLFVGGRSIESFSLAAGESRTFFPVPGTQPGFVGSATVQGEGGAKLVGIVNEIYTRDDQPGENALAYEAIGD